MSNISAGMAFLARLSDVLVSWPAFAALGSRFRSASITIIAICVVGVAVLVAAVVNVQANRIAREVSISIEIRERAERFLGHVRDAETGQRGYLLTGSRSHLVNYVDGRSNAFPELDAIAALVDNDPVQKARVDTLRSEAGKKLDELARTISLTENGQRDLALNLVRGGDGTRQMEELREMVLAIQTTENEELTLLNSREERRRFLGSIGVVIALAGLAFAAWQQSRSRQRRVTSLSMSNAELERKVAERTQQLEEERMRIEALLRDVNHRVGNNLAMVSALLSVQSRQSRDPSVKAALAQAQARIQAIAAGQRRLRLDLETDEIDARAYMEDLLAEIGRAAEGRPITIRLDMSPIRLPGRDAVSFVVIVNELVTNAIKHAFPDGMTGTIKVRLSREAGRGDGDIVLVVEDDGVGIAGTGESNGLGQTVIKSLMRSMRATMDVGPCDPQAPRPGTCAKLVFANRTAQSANEHEA